MSAASGAVQVPSRQGLHLRQNSCNNIIAFGFPSYIDNSAEQKVRVLCGMQTAMTNLSNGDKRFWVHLISTYVISWYVYKVSIPTCHNFWSNLVHVCYERVQHDRCMKSGIIKWATALH